MAEGKTQIISFVENSVVLDEPQLAKILETIGEAPVAIITVASREEGQLVTSALKKYLPGTNDPCNSLKEKVPAHSDALKVNGLWIHEPILAKNINGEALAILILEAQVKYGDTHTDDQWRKIVGFSMFTSSIMIVSCSKYIQENILTTITHNCPREEEMNLMKLQNLVFFVQNWDGTIQYQNGKDGGSAMLNTKLADNSSRNATIKESFENVECLLLPQIKFSTGFNPECRKYLEEFCSEDIFVTKEFFGKRLKAKQVLKYCVKYIEVLNDDRNPFNPSLAVATLEIFQQNEILEAFSFYSENMKHSIESNSLEEDALVKCHENWEKEAKSFLFDFGDDSEKMRDTLQNCIKEGFTELKSYNQENRARHLKEKYAEEYKNALTFFSNNQSSYDPEEVDTFSSQLVSNLLTSAQDAMAKLQIVTEELTEIFETDKSAIIFQRNQEFFEEKMNQVFQNYCTDCDGISESGIEEHFKNAKLAVMTKFITETKQANGKYPELFQKYLQDLERMIDTFSEEKIASLKKERFEQLKLVAENCMKVVLDDYKEHMNSEKNLKNENLIIETYEVKSAEARNQFIQANQDLDFVSIGFFIDQLNRDMLATKTELLERFQRKRRAIEENFLEAYQNGLLYFSNKLLTFLQKKQFYDDEILENQKEAFWKEAVKVYSDFPKVHYCKENFTEFWNKLENQCNLYYKTIAEQNRANRCKVLEEMIILQQQSQRLYDNEFKKSYKLARNEEMLLTYHNGAKKVALDTFRTKSYVNDSSVWEPFLKTLEEDIETSYADIFEVCEIKWSKEADVTEKALVDAKSYYHEEMGKNLANKRFINPFELDKIHKNIVKNSIARCNNVTLSEFQKEDLKDSLEITYKKYKDENTANLPQDPVIGIDLGTTYCCAAYYHRGKTYVIPNKIGQNTTPSYVAFVRGGSIVGEAAKANENPKNSIFDAKRMIGRRFDDEILQRDIKHWPFRVIEQNQCPVVEIDGITYTAEEISAKLLVEMKEIAEKKLGCPVKKAVITVPAYFNDGQRQATKDAGVLAGLEVLRIINEPTAAAIAYKIAHMDSSTRNILIFDLGGGTFDVAVLEMKRGEINVKATGGDAHLGGEDFDSNIVDYCVEKFKETKGIDLLKDRNSANFHDMRDSLRLLRRLRNESERQKKFLSETENVNVATDGVTPNMDMNIHLSKETFEQINEDLFDRTIEILDEVLATAGVSKSAIDDIVLVGGSTRIPKIRQLLSNYFDGKTLSHKIHPDEAVAIGAAIQGAIINGRISKDSLDYNELSDVNPFSIGIEVLGGGMSVIIPRNTTIPKTILKDYYTVKDDQTSVSINIFQGEKIVAADNVPLGNFILDGIPPNLKGREEIIVEVEIDFQGVLHVTATCSSNGVSKTGLAVTEQKWRLTRETIQRILTRGTGETG